MILSRCCEARLAPISLEKLKSGELKRRFRCVCCLRMYSAYSRNDGETWAWEQRPAHRPASSLTLEFA